MFIFTSCDDLEGAEEGLLPHEHLWGEWAIIKEATCTEDGKMELYCSLCGYAKGVTIDKKGHTEGEWEITREATCDIIGKKVVRCLVCDDIIKSMVISKLEHNFSGWVLDSETTCTEDGKMHNECTSCGYISKQTTPALGHTEGEWEIVREATCAEEGKKQIICTVCGEVVKEMILPAAHIFNGNYECIFCGINLSAADQRIIFEFGEKGEAQHMDGSDLGKEIAYTFDEYTLNFTDMYKIFAPSRDAHGNSCIKIGTANTPGTLSFTVPDEVYAVIINIAKYKDYESKVIINGTEYTLTKNSHDGEYDIIVVDTSITKTVTISTVDDGKRVMMDSIVFVLAPDAGECQHSGGNATCQTKATCTICGEKYGELGEHNYADSNCCYDCGNIDISCFVFTLLDDGTYSIRAKNVDNMPSKVVIPNAYDGKLVTVISDSAFRECANIIEITMPDSITYIDAYAFGWCNSIISIEIPESVTTIVHAAFAHCYSLKSIKIPDSVTLIDNYVFRECTSLTSIVIPDSVTTLGHSAFRTCTNLTNVVIGNGITNIDCGTFDSCTNLVSIIIGNGVTTISEYAFSLCESLDKIYYNGSEEEWNKISIENSNAQNDYLVNATRYYYSETEPTEEGNFWHWVDGEPTVWDAHIHSYTIATTAPTCTEQGYTTYTCACGDSYVENYTNALGHTEAIDSAVDATCTTSGLTEGKHCSVCGEVIVAQDSISALGHEISEWSVVNPDADADEREFSGACETCGEVENISLYERFSDLTYVTFGDSITYGVDGVDWGLMEDPYPELVSRELNFKTFNNVAVSGATYCENSLGRTNMTKKILSFTGKADIISLMLGVNDCYVGLPLGTPESRDNTTIYGSLFLISEYLTENYEDALIFYMTPFPYRTCYTNNSAGYKLEDVANAIKYVAAHYDIPVLDMYLYSEYENNGMNLGDGLHPSQSFMREFTTPKIVEFIKAHYGVEYKHQHTEVIDESVAPTCTEEGLTEGKHCSVCDEIIVAQEIIPAGHNYADSNCCYNCGNIDISYFDFTLLDDGTYEISAKDVNNMPSNVVIPSTYANSTVSKIKSNGFYNCDVITSIVTFDGLINIGNYAFAECNNLTNAVIADSVVKIEHCAFDNCKNLSNLTIGNNITHLGHYAFYNCSQIFNIYNNCRYIGTEENPYMILVDTVNKTLSTYDIHEDTRVIAEYAFSHVLDYLTSIVIPDNVEYINDGAFNSRKKLTSVTFGKNLKVIEGYVFYECSNITEIVLPEGLTHIGTGAFYACSKLNRVVIPDSLTAIEDWAFTHCSSLTSVVIGNSVSTIGSCSFCNCDNLTYVKLGDNVSLIKDSAFSECEKLSTIVLPKSITLIEEYAFNVSPNLKNIYYCSSYEDWSNIIIETGNSKLVNYPSYRYYYSETQPTTEGNFWHWVDGEPTVWE